MTPDRKRTFLSAIMLVACAGIAQAAVVTFQGPSSTGPPSFAIAAGGLDPTESFSIEPMAYAGFDSALIYSKDPCDVPKHASELWAQNLGPPLLVHTLESATYTRFRSFRRARDAL